jgi:pseudaminic acid biosynthesis-associated methylase
MKRQLEAWEGEFGTSYTNRNVVDPASRLEAFRTMLGGLSLSGILEVGCNRGHNLVVLRKIFGEEAEIVGIEPNQYARTIARQTGNPVLRGNAVDLPFRSGAFELVMTVGVLIHVALSDLPLAMTEIARTSSRFILCAEYFAQEETEVEYRGNSGLLWKRNFLKHYQRVVPGITVERSGYWEKENGFDRTHWWLLSKMS